MERKIKTLKRVFLMPAVLGLAFCLNSCKVEKTTKITYSPDDSIETTLAKMRLDKELIDSLTDISQVVIGEGATCLDPVQHLFLWDGRFWVYNQDWGGVLELPEGYIPEDDPWQADFSYHGSIAWSKDSTVLVKWYAGFQSFDLEEYEDLLDETYEEDSITIITSRSWEKLSTESWGEVNLLKYTTLNEDGIEGVHMVIHRSPDGVEYEVSVQYPKEQKEKVSDILRMIDRFPFGPSGQTSRGMALL